MTRIGIDIDDVLYDFDGTAREFLVEDPRALFAPEPITEAQRIALRNGVNHELWDGIANIIGEKNWDWFWDNIDNHGIFWRGKGLPGARAAVEELAKRHEVWLLTARKQPHSWQTWRWLDRANLSVTGVVHGHSKWNVAEVLGLKVVVDDGPRPLKNYLRKVKGPMKGAYIYGISHYEPLESSYYRFKYVDSLKDVLADEERWS